MTLYRKSCLDVYKAKIEKIKKEHKQEIEKYKKELFKYKKLAGKYKNESEKNKREAAQYLRKRNILESSIAFRIGTEVKKVAQHPLYAFRLPVSMFKLYIEGKIKLALQNSDKEEIFKYKKIYARYFLDRKKIAIITPMLRWEDANSVGDYHFAIALKKYFERQQYKVEIRIIPDWYQDFDGLHVIVLRGSKKYDPKIIHNNIMWNISHPDMVTKEEYEKYDHVFVSSLDWTNQLQNLVDVPVEPMLQCTDHELFYKEITSSKDYQILFVGNTRNVFRQIIQDVLPTKYNLAIYGKGWEQYIDAKYIKDISVPNTEVPEKYSACEILLNDHWKDMAEHGFISNRLFDGLAAGAFIISDDVKGLKEVLGDSIVIYSDKEDLREKIDYYMQHPEERKKLVEKGQKMVLEKHTFQKRVEQFISAMQKYL